MRRTSKVSWPDRDWEHYSSGQSDTTGSGTKGWCDQCRPDCLCLKLQLPPMNTIWVSINHSLATLDKNTTLSLSLHQLVHSNVTVNSILSPNPTHYSGFIVVGPSVLRALAALSDQLLTLQVWRKIQQGHFRYSSILSHGHRKQDGDDTACACAVECEFRHVTLLVSWQRGRALIRNEHAYYRR